MYWIAFGDIHESTGRLEAVPGLAEADGVIVTGDLTNRGGREAGKRVLDAVARFNPRILAQPGNMDSDSVTAYLREQDMDIHLKARELAPGLGLMGVGLSTPHPVRHTRRDSRSHPWSNGSTGPMPWPPGSTGSSAPSTSRPSIPGWTGWTTANTWAAPACAPFSNEPNPPWRSPATYTRPRARTASVTRW